MPKERVQKLRIDFFKIVDSSRRSKIQNEVMIRLKTVKERDYVQSFAPNLIGNSGAGIRLDIPEHLQGTFKLLEGHANRLKARYKEGVKRSIKFMMLIKA